MSEQLRKPEAPSSNLVQNGPSVVPGSPVDPASAIETWKHAAEIAASMTKSAGGVIVDAARATGRVAQEAAILVGDLNGDGKVDQEDARIAAEKAKTLASATATEAGKLGKEVLQHDMVKDAAAGAAIGAVVAVPIPLVGPAAGAAVGAIAGVIKNVFSKIK